MIPAYDLLGLGSAHWDISDTLAVFPTLAVVPQGWGFGCFDGGRGSWPHNFGDPRGKVEIILQQRRPAVFRLQAWWDPGHNLPPLKALIARLKLWANLPEKYPDTTFFMSPSCEYNCRDLKKLKPYFDAVATYCPTWRRVSTPMGGSLAYPGTTVERHGSKATAKPGELASWDGQSTYDFDPEAWNRRNASCIAGFLWGVLCNGAEAHNTLTPDRRTQFPDIKYLTALTRLAQSKGAPMAPSFPGKVIPFGKTFALKSHGEDLQGKNTRDNKPLIIVGNAANDAEILGWNGKSLGKFGYFGTYPGNRFRYYSGWKHGVNLWGYELADLAQSKTGNPWVYFKVGNKIYGPANPAFCEGFTTG